MWRDIWLTVSQTNSQELRVFSETNHAMALKSTYSYAVWWRAPAPGPGSGLSLISLIDPARRISVGTRRAVGTKNLCPFDPKISTSNDGFCVSSDFRAEMTRPHVVLNKGVIEEQGTHDRPVRNCGGLRMFT
jgi:hypothetical protein